LKIDVMQESIFLMCINTQKIIISYILDFKIAPLQLIEIIICIFLFLCTHHCCYRSRRRKKERYKNNLVL